MSVALALGMITAHLPAGYLLTRWLRQRGRAVPMLWGLLASIFPDIDLLYFYLIDHRRTLHHHYWTHLPLFWAGLSVGLFAVLRAARARFWKSWTVVFIANVYVHLLLDTVVGKIAWLAPLSWHEFYLFEVPAAHGWWLWNFVFHWSFGFEVLMWAAALVVWQRDRAGAASVLSGAPEIAKPSSSRI
jgi:inner membrane protein